MTDDTTDTVESGIGGAYTEMMQQATASKAEESQQLHEETFANARGGALSPPYPPAKLAKLIELNTTHAKCGFSKARNVAGYGLEIIPHPEVENPSSEQKSIAEDFWFGPDSTWQVGPMASELATPADVLEMAWADYEFIGWLSIETLVATNGTPTGLAYVPAPTIRKRKDDPGFVQTRDGDLRYFGAFGNRYGEGRNDRTFVDANTGESGPGVSGSVANEILFKRNHTPFVDHYGTPDIVPAIPNIGGDQAAREFNIDFFENNAVPRIGIIVEGGQLTEESRQSIREIMHGMNNDNHRTMILEVEKVLEEEFSGFDEGDKPKIRIEPLTVGLEEDASFLEFHDHNEHEIIKAHEVPPIEIGQIKSGSFSTDAEAQRRGYLETVIEPKQEAFAQLLYETVHDALGVTDYTIRFKTRGVDTRLSDAQVAKTRVEASQGAVTLNEVRGWLGVEPLERPAGEMLLLEVTGGAPGAGIGGAIEDLIGEQVGDIREEVMQEVRTESRITSVLDD